MFKELEIYKDLRYIVFDLYDFVGLVLKKFLVVLLYKKNV